MALGLGRLWGIGGRTAAVFPTPHRQSFKFVLGKRLISQAKAFGRKHSEGEVSRLVCYFLWSLPRQNNTWRICHCVNFFEQEAYNPPRSEGQCTPMIVKYNFNFRLINHAREHRSQGFMVLHWSANPNYCFIFALGGIITCINLKTTTTCSWTSRKRPL